MKKPGRWFCLVSAPTLLMLAVIEAVLGDDNSSVEALRAFRRNTPLLNFFLSPFSDYANILFYMAYAIILAVAIKKRDRASGWFVGYFLVSLVVTLFIVNILKIFISRPRPFVSGNPEGLFAFDKKFHSFPSNHFSEIFAATLPLALRLRAVRFAAVVGVYNALAGFARLYLGSHYPSDILGSLILGCLVNVVCLRLCNRNQANK